MTDDDTAGDTTAASGPDGDRPDHGTEGRQDGTSDDTAPTGGKQAAGSRDLAHQPASPRGQVASMPAAAPRPPRRTGVFLDAQDLRSHVGDLLRAIVGSYRVDTFGNFTFDHETARVFVTVGSSPMGPIVGVFSVTNTALELDGDLASWLARTNHRLMLGTLSWDDDNDAVWLRHNLVGTHLDPAELQAAVRSVATSAAAVGDEISERFGGTRMATGDGASDTDDTGSENVDGVEPPGFDEPGGDAVRSNTTGYL